jgi:hypothetical protein
MVSRNDLIRSQSVFSDYMEGSLSGVDSNLIRFMVLGSGL